MFGAHSTWLVAVGLAVDGTGNAEEWENLVIEIETLQEVLLLPDLLEMRQSLFDSLTCIYCHTHTSFLKKHRSFTQLLWLWFGSMYVH